MTAFMKGDVVELWALGATEYEIARYTEGVNKGDTLHYVMTGLYPLTPAEVRKSWESAREHGDINLGIWTKIGSAMEFVGGCGLYSPRNITRSYELRIIIFDERAVGKGVGTEAVELLCGYAFERLNAHKVWLGVNKDNVRAVKCYEGVGFVREGELRDEIFYFGKYANAVRMSILESEWASTAQ